MNEAIKKAWVEALRSGKYKQGFGRLRDESNSFCCLGVLCDLGERKAWVRHDIRKSWEYADPERPSYSSWSILPDGIADIVGLSRRSQYELSIMNDSRNYSFEEIADWIEDNL